MKLQQLLSDDDAVSPVIGVILMVAITVILAAVIGAFVLGIGGNQSVAPQVQFDTEEVNQSDGDVTYANFTHSSGDTVDDPGERVSLAGPVFDITDDRQNDSVLNASDDGGLEVGDKVRANLTDDAENGDDVRIVWSAAGSSDTNSLITYELANQ